MSLAEIAGDVFGYAQGHLWSAEIEEWLGDDTGPSFRIDTGPPFDECEAYANWFMSRFLEQFARDIRVACPTGATLKIPADRLTVETDDPFDYNDYREFPNSREGRLRAGGARPVYIKFEGMRITDNLDDNWDASWRLISNFPLCIPEMTIPVSTELLIDLVTSRASKAGDELDQFTQGDQYKKLVQEMIAAWDRGEIPTKAKQQARFGRGRKHEEWMAVRRVLVQARPEAAKSGPRPGPRIR